MHGTKKKKKRPTNILKTLSFFFFFFLKENISFIENTIELVIFNIFGIVLGRVIVGIGRLYKDALIDSIV